MNHTDWMAPIIAAHPQRPKQSSGGISALSSWLTNQGIDHTFEQAKTLQKYYICEAFREAAKNGEPFYLHCTPAR